ASPWNEKASNKRPEDRWRPPLNPKRPSEKKKLRALHSKVAGPLADLTACRRAGSTRISHHATPSDSNLPLRLTDLASPSQAHQLGHAASHRDPAPSREPSIQS
uniref:Uncharacterized protein n=1 Tax=Aegilops tauschii subsp. strangulata TaxID=200361 RepID=A0A453R1Q4_AEGTS